MSRRFPRWREEAHNTFGERILRGVGKTKKAWSLLMGNEWRVAAFFERFHGQDSHAHDMDEA
jgi:hypothetical protein